MGKPATALMLIALACLAAAVFGAVHNQMSYSIGPTYFTALKFIQFNIPPGLPERLGAALVGARAGWLMGLVVGAPVFALGIYRCPDARVMRHVGLRTIAWIALLAATFSVSGLIVGQVLPESLLMKLPAPLVVPDRANFIRAALIHDFTYFGGGLGLIAGLWTIWHANRTIT